MKRENRNVTSIIGHNLVLDFSLNNGKGPNHIYIEFLYDAKDILKEYYLNEKKLSPGLYDFLNARLKFLVKKPRFEIINASKSFEEADIFLTLLWHKITSQIIFNFDPTYQESLHLDDQFIDSIICRCFSVGREEIHSCIANGAKDIITVTNLTKACGACGNCRNDIEALFSDQKLDLYESATSKESELKIELARIKRQKIMGLYPIEFLITYLFPIARKEGFEIQGLVEDTLYIKSEHANLALETFIKENNLKLTTFYI